MKKLLDMLEKYKERDVFSYDILLFRRERDGSHILHQLDSTRSLEDLLTKLFDYDIRGWELKGYWYFSNYNGIQIELVRNFL